MRRCPPPRRLSPRMPFYLEDGIRIPGEGKSSGFPVFYLFFWFVCAFQTRSSAGWKRVLRSLCRSRTRVPLLAAIYFLMIHVLLVLCFTGHL